MCGINTEESFTFFESKDIEYKVQTILMYKGIRKTKKLLKGFPEYIKTFEQITNIYSCMPLESYLEKAQIFMEDFKKLDKVNKILEYDTEDINKIETSANELYNALGLIQFMLTEKQHKLTCFEFDDINPDGCYGREELKKYKTSFKNMKFKNIGDITKLLKSVGIYIDLERYSCKIEKSTCKRYRLLNIKYLFTQ